ncbi:MAG: hypothetical protein P8Y97_12680 [Candidatus Lokiarchaeota archaeon]
MKRLSPYIRVIWNDNEFNKFMISWEYYARWENILTWEAIEQRVWG